jgi:hypothetical protein
MGSAFHLRHAVLHGERRLQYLDRKQNESHEPGDILDVSEAATVLHCCKSHVSNILNGKVPNVPPIPHVRAGRKRLIRYGALVDWFKAQEAASVEMVAQC